MRLKMIEHWRKFWRMSSVQISAAATAIWAYLLSAPETMLSVLNSLPPDMRHWLPPLAPVAIFALVTFARLVRQEKINGGK